MCVCVYKFIYINWGGRDKGVVTIEGYLWYAGVKLTVKMAAVAVPNEGGEPRAATQYLIHRNYDFFFLFYPARN